MYEMCVSWTIAKPYIASNHCKQECDKTMYWHMILALWQTFISCQENNKGYCTINVYFMHQNKTAIH